MHFVPNHELHIENKVLQPSYDMPHHAVFKESTTTRLRVVFDASRKTSTGISLNDVLLTGPAIQNNLIDVLLQWRCHRYCFMADIEKMYRQVKVHHDDTSYQRIIWRDDTSNQMRDYYLSTVTFGVTCAPYLAIRVLQQLAIDEQGNFPIGSNTLLHDMYVDDLLSGDETIIEAKEKRKRINALLKSGGFKLRKWLTNHSEILKDVPFADQALYDDVNLNLENVVKSLGLIWYPKVDSFGYRLGIDQNSEVTTKRQLLSEIARLYDPLGWISPVIVVAKSLMQDVWIHGIDWDEDILVNLHTRWTEFKSSIAEVETLRIPRWLNITKMAKIVEIHAFSDASKVSYAAAIYIKCEDESGVSHTQLLMAKSKVKPIKAVSIPRLELCGVVLAARLIKYIRNISQFSNLDVYLWTDSMIVLCWLNTHPSKWKTFIANRTSEVLEILCDSPRHHVSSADNPADIASRGIPASQLIYNELWWHGPKWLQFDKADWPIQPPLSMDNVENLEVNVVHLKTSLENTYMLSVLTRYSSLSKLICVTAQCLRFVQRSRKLLNPSGRIEPSERKGALNSWIKFIQATEFKDDIHNLKTI